MSETPDLEPLLLAAVDELNAQLDTDQQVAPDLDKPLIGAGGQLDSIGLVNLIVVVEGKLQEEHGLALTLADERAFSQSASPFRTLAALRDYVGERMREETDA